MPTVQNNALAFGDQKDFKSFVRNLQNQPDDNLNKFMDQHFAKFTSLKQSKEEILQKKSTSPKTSEILQLDVEDPNFASIVNQNGVFQIGEQIFKVTNKYTYIFKNRDAFNTFTASNIKNSASGPQNSYLEPTPCSSSSDPALVQVSSNVYRTENCGAGGGGGGGYDPGDDDDGPHVDIDELDPYANLDIDYPSKRTQTYHSGGTRGRLKGKSWNQNFYVYSSVGIKSVHERHTWGKWRNRSADKITLDGFIKYSYGEKLINPTQLTQSLKVKLADITDLIGGGVDNYLQHALSLVIGDKYSVTVYDAFRNKEFTILTQKVQDDRFTYNIYPTDLQQAYSHSKSHAKKIQKVFDWSTAIIAFPPNIKQTAVDFELDIIRAKHTMQNDGYTLGFITDKRK